MKIRLLCAAAAAALIAGASAEAAPADIAQIPQIAAPSPAPAVIANVWSDALYRSAPPAPGDVAFSSAAPLVQIAQVDPRLRERTGAQGVSRPATSRSAAPETLLLLAQGPSRSANADLALLLGLADSRPASRVPRVRFGDVAGALYRQGLLRSPEF